jgi:hypothetical protein
MELKEIIVSQYLAAMEMLRAAIEACPDPLWDDPGDKNRFWQVAFHALFYTHLYLQPAEADFAPWDEHSNAARRIGTPTEGEEGTPVVYSKRDVLDYMAFCREEVRRRTAEMDPQAESGFYWLPMNKLELQFYSIRHIQQHAGELFERLGIRAGIEDLGWVGQVHEGA